jgi:hypothetical protein
MTRVRLFAIGFSLHLWAAFSYAGPIDLNDFVATGDVTVAPDGSTATLVIGDEFPGQLTNDGTPPVIVATAGTSLEFDYEYVFVQPNLGSFSATLYDTDVGVGFGNLEASFAGSFSESGSVSWDLSGFVGINLGLRFLIDSDDPGFRFSGSNATVSNLAITTNIPTPSAPEPATQATTTLAFSPGARS